MVRSPAAKPKKKGRKKRARYKAGCSFKRSQAKFDAAGTEKRMRAKAGRTGPANPFVILTDPHIFDKDPRGRKRLTYDERIAGVKEAEQIMSDAIAMEEAKRSKIKSPEPAATQTSSPGRKKRNPKGKPKKSKTKTNSPAPTATTSVSSSQVAFSTTTTTTVTSTTTLPLITPCFSTPSAQYMMQWMNAQYMMQLMQMQWMGGNVSGATGFPQPSEGRGELDGGVDK